MFKPLYDVLNEISELKTTKEKVEALVTNRYVEAIKVICKYTYDTNIKWLLPEGEPPYKPCDLLDIEGRLLHEIRRLYLFVEGGNPNLTKARRETLFIQVLESVDSKDAKLLLSMKERKLPFKGLNKRIIHQAFPDINIEVTKESKDEQVV
jgi:hypothetical protein